jgi:hypothetical protein
MNYQNLNTKTWDLLDYAEDPKTGYQSICLSRSENEYSNFHIFLDENRSLHFALMVEIPKNSTLIDPKVSGLKVQISHYKIGGNSIEQFVDLTCTILGFKSEFTTLIREICKMMYAGSLTPFESINQVVRNFKAFWSNEPRKLLSDEFQLGLICELFIVKKLFELKYPDPLESWKGPFGYAHDFSFVNYDLEIKATKRQTHCHTINGLNQLEPIGEKGLALFSFKVILSNSETSQSLQGVVENICNTSLKDRPDLILRFYELLSLYGYSPVYEEEYRKLKILISEIKIYEIVDGFPCIISGLLNETIISRISGLTYDLNFEGLIHKSYYELDWDLYLK